MAISYSEWLFDRINADIQACNLRFFVSIILGFQLQLGAKFMSIYSDVM